MQRDYGVDSMPQTAENVAKDFNISRADQDAFALWSQTKAAQAQSNGRLASEITPVVIPQRKGDPLVVDTDEHLRATTAEALAKLKPIVKTDGTVTAGNASGVNDGATALIIASAAAIERHGLRSIAVPLRNSRGMVIAALNIGMALTQDPVDRMMDQYLPHMHKVQSGLQRLL